MSPDRPRRLQISPRLVVLGALLVSYGWALVVPLRLSRPPSGLLATTYVVGLALFGGALALVLRSAVSPEQSQRTRIALIGVLVIVTLGLWLPAYAWAVPGQEPWAWVAGFAIGACALAVPRAGVIVAVGLGAMAAAGAVVFDGSVVQNLGFALGSAAVVWLTGLVLVWLLGLVWAAEAGREAEADLVLAQERLRVSRELHDVLGHRLGIIALKAELAADLAATDPARSAAESGEIREIAAATLAEARRAVHGETVADLATQIASAELVLGSAGIETTIDVDSAQVSPSASRLLAAVVREAVTNILRHSDARKVSITFDGTERCSTLVIVNDGARRPKNGTAPDGPSSGTGLAVLAARCATAGGRLVSGPANDGRFARGATTEWHRTAMTDPTIRVLIADDEELIREALVALLERETDIEVVATAADGRQAVDRALAHRPDVAVVDLQMPVVDGVGVVTELSRQLPACAGVILTGHGRPHLLRQALTSGARGFLAKGAPSTALADVVRRVHEGHRYVDPILAADALTAAPSPLTPREGEVLAIAQEDRPIREVARAVFLSPGTVRNYLATITQKLEAGSRAEAYRIARENGWI
jgi:two-component system, NarL family, sensor histidine kinase DesK